MRILIVATYLPPYNGSGNIRILNYINYLNRLGNYIDVVTVEYPKDSIAYDVSLENVFDNEIKIFRLKPGILYNMFYKKKSNENEQKSSKSEKRKISKLNIFKSKISYLIKTTVLIPDSFVFWIKPAYKLCCNLMNKNRYDLIFTIHETPSSHVVGYKLKKKFNDLKWVSYWSDPWNGDSVIRAYSSYFKRKIEGILEEKIVLNSDKLLFTTNATRKMYVNRYKIDANKTDIVYRGYDCSLYKIIEEENHIPKQFEKDKINIVHTGIIYEGLRDIKPLYTALLKIKNENIGIYEKLNIIFVGQFTDYNDKNMMQELECIKTIDTLPFKEAIKYVVFADALLLYGNKNSTQVPGKLYEYVGSNGKIFTILGSSDDELKDIMLQVNKGPIVNNSYEELSIKIIELYKSILLKQNNEWNKPYELFEWNKVAKDLEEKLKIN